MICKEKPLDADHPPTPPSLCGDPASWRGGRMFITLTQSKNETGIFNRKQKIFDLLPREKPISSHPACFHVADS